MRHSFGVNPEADGSVFYEQGLNKLIVNVHGPHEPTHRVLQDEATEVVVRISQAPFAGTEWKKKRVGDRKIMEIEAKIKEILEAVIDVRLYPQSEITVSVNIFEQARKRRKHQKSRLWPRLSLCILDLSRTSTGF